MIVTLPLDVWCTHSYTRTENEASLIENPEISFPFLFIDIDIRTDSVSMYVRNFSNKKLQK